MYFVVSDGTSILIVLLYFSPVFMQNYAEVTAMADNNYVNKIITWLIVHAIYM